MPPPRDSSPEARDTIDASAAFMIIRYIDNAIKAIDDMISSRAASLVYVVFTMLPSSVDKA